MNNKYLFCIVGRSGSGKTSVVEKLKSDGYTSIDSYTTRPKRSENEVGHRFITEEEFKALNDVVAYTYYNNNHYGVTSKDIDDNDLYVVDIPGVKMLKEEYKGDKRIIVIGLTGETFALVPRMTSRGDTLESAFDRVKYDDEAFKDIKSVCDYIIDTTNIDLSQTYEQVFNIINSYTNLNTNEDKINHSYTNMMKIFTEDKYKYIPYLDFTTVAECIKALSKRKGKDVIVVPSYHNYYKCPVCDVTWNDNSNFKYCPNCGQSLKEDGDN